MPVRSLGPSCAHKLGFTGTRAGMTARQCQIIRYLLEVSPPAEVHHGDCIGADAEFHELALEAGIPVILHPPEDDKLRAFCGLGSHEGAIGTCTPAPYLKRNQAIVLETDLLLAAPKEQSEPEPARGQGTWSTVRFARRSGRPYTIVKPRSWMDLFLGNHD
jgi:hypothetical protein